MPKIKIEQKEKKIGVTIRLTPTSIEKLYAVHKETNNTMSDIVNTLINKYL